MSLPTHLPQPAPATHDDVAEIWLLRRQLEDWIIAQGIDQWRPGEVPESVIESQVREGEWHVLREGGVLKAALRVLYEDLDFWGVVEEPSVFVHGLMVDREFAGGRLGSSLLVWAAAEGGRQGAKWLRLDSSAGNPRLSEYYAGLGFTSMGTKKLGSGLFDVTLWQRPVGGVEEGSGTAG